MDTTDNLNSSSSLDDEMNMMLMMMQLPEFSSPHGDDDDAVASFQPLEFSLATTSTSTVTTSIHSTMPQANSLDNPPMHWSSFTHLPSTTISFTNNPTTPMLQEQDQTPPTILSNSATTGALSGAYAYATVSSGKRNSVAEMREMILRITKMQPIHIDPESVKPPKRKNVKISKDPRSVAARHRRERIRERIRILQRLVPGGSKMDTASMLDEAIHYVKFLKSQVQSLERVTTANSRPHARIGFPVSLSSGSSGTATSYLPLSKPHQASQIQSVVLLRDA